MEPALCRFDNTAGDVGAMVGNALQVREQVGPDEAYLDGAVARLHTADVVCAQEVLEVVDDLLKRLYLGGDGKVLCCVSFQRKAEYLADRARDDGKLLLRFGGEAHVLFRKLLGGFENVNCVVGDSFEVTDYVQEARGFVNVIVREPVRAELDEVTAENVLVSVDGAFVAAHRFCALRGEPVLRKRGDGLLERGGGKLRHFAREYAAALDSDRGCTHKALVYGDGLVFFKLLFGYGDYLQRKLFEQACAREEQYRAENIECGVANGDGKLACARFKNCYVENRCYYTIYNKEESCAEHVERKVNNRGAARVSVRADRGEKRRNASADVLTHYYRNRHSHAYRTR